MSYDEASTPPWADTTIAPPRPMGEDDHGERFAVPSRYNIIVRLNGGRALAYNSLTGTFTVWEPHELAIYERIEAGEQFPLDAPWLHAYLELGYVVADDTDEFQAIREHYESLRFDAGRMMVTIAPTLGCNFGCSYCFQGQDKPIERMSDEVQDAFIEFLRGKLPEVRELAVVWYGGEPLMGKRIIYDLSDRMLALCEEYGVTYQPAFIVTNGYSLNRKTAQALYDRQVRNAQITIDGPADTHDQMRHLVSGRPTYERILRNLEEVVQTVPLNISIRVNVSEANKDAVRRLIDDLAERGFGQYKRFGMYFAPIEAITSECQSCDAETLGKIAWGETEHELQRYAFAKGLAPLPRAPRFMGMCQAILPNGLLLTPEGDIHKCWDTVMNPEQRVGTIFEPSNLTTNGNYRQWLQWSPFDNPVCSSCKILPNCAGFCAFKFVHADRTSGEAGSLPCPSWKFDMAENLFFRAEKMGLVSPEDWRPDQGTVAAQHTGIRHSFDSVAKAAHKLSAIPVRVEQAG